MDDTASLPRLPSEARKGVNAALMLLNIPYISLFLYQVFSDDITKLTNKIIVILFQSMDILLAFPLIIFVAGAFYWLKLKHQFLYGSIEILIASLTILAALINLESDSTKQATVLQLFAGIYILIRGMDNIEKSIKIRFLRSLLKPSFILSQVVILSLYCLVMLGFPPSSISNSNLNFVLRGQALFIVNGIQIFWIKMKVREAVFCESRKNSNEG